MFEVSSIKDFEEGGIGMESIHWSRDGCFVWVIIFWDGRKCGDPEESTISARTGQRRGKLGGKRRGIPWIQTPRGRTHGTKSLFRLRYFSFPGRECLYDVVVDTNIQFERADSKKRSRQMGFSGLKWGKMKWWHWVSRSHSVPMPSGSWSKTITASMLFQCRPPREFTSTSSTKYLTQLHSTFLKSFRNLSVYPKKKDQREWLLSFWQSGTYFPNFWTLSEKWSRQVKWRNWRLCSTWWR